MSRPQTRTIIRNYAEARGYRYRITAAREVHFYGQMPNSIETGWWLFSQTIEGAIKEITK